MSLVSAALRTVRGAYTRTSSRMRRPVARSGTHHRGIDGGGPFLHWVPDHPDGARLAGEYVPIALEIEHRSAVPPRSRRRR